MTRLSQALLGVALLSILGGHGHAAPLPLVVPVPKRIMARDDAPLRLSSRTVLIVPEGAGRRAAELIQAQARALSPSFVLPIAERARPGQKAIVFRTTSRIPQPEGYTLRVESSGAVVEGQSQRGLWYGAQTLCQLMQKDNAGVSVPSVQVNDWPSLSYRGALLFVGRNARPFHHKLIARVLARCKLNAVLLECEGVQWNALGRDAPPWAMSKADLRADIDDTRSNFLSVTPLIEGIGHMGWLLGAHPEWAEDPQTPYAIDTANPDAERRLFAVFAEAVATFHAPTLCIGGDEVNLRGRYPFRSLARFPTLADAYGTQVAREHAFLQKRGVRTWLWGDMLLAPGEGSDFCHAPNAAQARQMRAAVPRDVQVLDWHYTAAARYPSLDTLRQAGFGLSIGATWSDPANITGFSRALTAAGGRGLLQTIWAGYNQNEANLRHERAQFAACIIAADAAWNGGRSRLSAADAAGLFGKWYGPILPHS